MNQLKRLLLAITLILALFITGCGDSKNPATQDELTPSENTEQSEAANTESTSASSVEKTNDSESPSAIKTDPTDQGITVLSKSNTTITQAEKKKVLDELDAEIDTLINEMNEIDSGDIE